jgi:hypothetical protein
VTGSAVGGADVHPGSTDRVVIDGGFSDVLARVAVVGDPPTGGSARWLARWYDAAQLGSVVAEPPPGDGPVLVLGERRFEREVGREAALLADRLDVGVARRLLPHGPLAVRYLAETAAENWVLGAAVAVELLDRAAAGTFSAAWMPRVGSLSSPAPSLGQHLRSWLPGGRGFLAVHVPGDRVHAVTQLDHVLAPEGRGPLLVGGDLPDHVRDAVLAGTGCQAAYEVAAVVAPRARYGSDRAVELVALPADVPSLLARHAEGSSCAVCGLSHSGPSCPFCHAGAVPLDVRGDQ